MPWRTLAATAALGLAACAAGPDYRKPEIDVPATFKEGVEWQRAQAGPQAALSSTWWLAYGDEALSTLVEQSLQANQSIAAAEAAYRNAQAAVAASTAGLFPTLTANGAASRGRGFVATNTGTVSELSNLVTASAAVGWEPDLWGQVRRQIEASRGNAQASDAQRAGQRLSISAAVASDYFALRQLDIDIGLLGEQQRIHARVFDMVQASFLQGASSSDDVLIAQDNLEAVVASLAAARSSRAQYEHALAVLVGEVPARFSLAPQPGYRFPLPPVPLALPSQLLLRRPDVVSAERSAAAANARIGVAQAAFFPSLTLTAQGGYQNTSLSHLFTVPYRVWSLGPSLALNLFDGGARSAAVREARSAYDQSVANYRQTVLTAFQNVEDNLSAYSQLQQQAEVFANVYGRNQRLFASQRAQREVGTASEIDLLTQQLTLLLAEQNLRDTQALLSQSSVALVKNLGGGWQWDEARMSDAQVPASTSGASATR